jgi:RNA polymerase sigma-70 factor, ECF subfamily
VLDLETVTEARLIAQALAGSQPAYEQVVRRYQRPVINLIGRMIARPGVDPGLAEDLAQETFVKAFRSLATFDASRRFSSWLFRIAHNTALDALRRPQPSTVSIDAPPDDPGHAPAELAAPPSADPAEQRALGRALEAALNRLRPEYRAAVSLRYDEGLAFDEIGHVLGVPEATARTHVHRARKELARLLDAAGWRP